MVCGVIGSFAKFLENSFRIGGTSVKVASRRLKILENPKELNKNPKISEKGAQCRLRDAPPGTPFCENGGPRVDFGTQGKPEMA